MKIMLDAGHYGKYNRSPAVPEYYESDFAWKMHLYLKEELEKYENIEVLTTRKSKENDLELTKRGTLSKGCDLFLSLHTNAVGRDVNEKVDYPVAMVLSEDNWTGIDEISRELGKILAKVIEETMETKQAGRIATRMAGYDRNKNGRHDDEYYGVLHGAKLVGVPGIILEHSFHTNTKVTKWLLKDENVRILAEKEAEVIANYYGLTKKETKVKIDYQGQKFEVDGKLIDNKNYVSIREVAEIVFQKVVEWNPKTKEVIIIDK